MTVRLDQQATWTKNIVGKSMYLTRNLTYRVDITLRSRGECILDQIHCFVLRKRSWWILYSYEHNDYMTKYIKHKRLLLCCIYDLMKSRLRKVHLFWQDKRVCRLQLVIKDGHDESLATALRAVSGPFVGTYCVVSVDTAFPCSTRTIFNTK